jgi:hypothetical protein
LLFCAQALGKHLEDEDVEAYTNEVKNYDTISRLDQGPILQNSISAENISD